jgi:hypothetical protein
VTPTYLDTSALLDWLESSAGASTPKAQVCGPKVSALLADPTRECGIGELAIIETLNGVHTLWRDTAMAGYGAAWARASQATLLETVAGGRIRILETGPQDIEHALMLVTKMTEEGRNFRAWDAMHLRSAVQWARSSSEVVHLVTSNGDFQGFLDLHPSFRRHLQLENLRQP